MAYAAGGDALAAEACHRVGVRDRARLQHLHRHRMVQLQVPRAIDGAEVARPDLPLQLVAAVEDEAGLEVVRAGHLVVGRRLADAQLGVDARQRHREVDGLGHVVVGALAERLHHVVALRLGRDHDDGQLGRRVGLAHRLQHLEAAHLRHHDVEQHERDLSVLELAQRRPPVLRPAHLEAFLLQAPHEQLAVVGMVVDDEDGVDLRHAAARAQSATGAGAQAWR